MSDLVELQWRVESCRHDLRMAEHMLDLKCALRQPADTEAIVRDQAAIALDAALINLARVSSR